MDALGRLIAILPQFFPPYFSSNYLKALVVPLGQTLEMAMGAMLVALAAGLGAAMWIAAGFPGARILYRLLASLRSVPDLTLAIFCVVLVGIGPAAGMLALALFYTAAVGKIFADLFLSADPEPLEALRSTGAGRLPVVLFGHLPLRLKDIFSYGVYEFESAIRASVIVGAVGGGGLGTEIIGTINAIDYRRTSTLILLLIVLIAAVDRCAHLLQRRTALLWAVLTFAVFSLWQNRPAAFAVSHAAATFATMLPPSLPREAVLELPQLLVETLEIAVGGTAIAALLAVPLGLCAARNLAPAAISMPVRRVLESLRAVPDVVWGLILVSAIGVGPQAGVAALAIHTTGTLGRLYAGAFESIPQSPVQALEATGARPLAIALFGYLPLAFAPLSVHTLFRFEWNMRAATVVGIIGAGGIGQALYNAQQLFFYKQMLAYLVITWLLVLLVDAGSSVLRRRLHLSDAAV